MSFASPAATLSGGITPADILQMLQDIADMAEDMENSFRRCIAEMLGLTPAELQALQDGIDAALDLRDMALAGKLSFAGLAATQQVLLAIGTAILVDKIATGLNVINGKIAELDAALPGIPAAGFADDVTAALDEFGNDVRDLRDDWDAKVPLAGTVILGPIAAASEVLETLWGLSIGGIFD
ncbi:MAG: hypothetical protein HQ519_04910 [Planctomycetes bacterium]|nr:hypothetical protein [Planctomycetota bacterium]